MHTLMLRPDEDHKVTIFVQNGNGEVIRSYQYNFSEAMSETVFMLDLIAAMEGIWKDGQTQ